MWLGKGVSELLWLIYQRQNIFIITHFTITPVSSGETLKYFKTLILLSVHILVCWKHITADPTDRAVYGLGLGPLACCDCGFDYQRGHGCLCRVGVVCCQVRDLCDEPIIRPEKSYRLWCVILCDLETA